MANQNFTRKLTAILTADVKGYSRLMGEDEMETVRTITTYREAMCTLIQDHRGRVVDSPGDNVLSEFASIIDALQCAVEIQKDFKAKNAELPEERRMEFRIGINLGDVIQDGERIYGDGVNIAARVESLAKGGGICITRTVFDHVRKKLQFGYEYIGEHTVKNIAEPLGVYRVLLEPEDAGKVIGENKAQPKQRSKTILATVVFVIVGTIAVAIWNMYLRSPPTEVASVEKKVVTLPDRPSIAVLPFNNMSGNPDYEYFSDGITEDIITDLSKIKNLLVIARNSTFVYKGKSIDIKEVGKKLGVRYVLEGSVRRIDNQVRINAQLIDTNTGYHLWAERYDGEMHNIFGLQDQINRKIFTELKIKLTADQTKSLTKVDTDSVEAYDNFLKGWAYYQLETPEGYTKAAHLFRKAIELDPNYSRAYGALAMILYNGPPRFGPDWHVSVGFKNAIDSSLTGKLNLETAMKNPNSSALSLSSYINAKNFLFEEALIDAQKAIELEPNSVDANLTMGKALIHAGKPNKAIEYLENYQKLNPNHPAEYFYYLALAQFSLDHMEESNELVKRAIRYAPDNSLYYGLAQAVSAILGHTEDVKVRWKKIKKDGRARGYLGHIAVAQFFFLHFNNLEVVKRFAGGLLKAGVPGKMSDLKIISKKNRLTGLEIKDEIIGKTLLATVWGGTTGVKYSKNSEIIEFSAYINGKFPENANQIAGQYSIENNKLCTELIEGKTIQMSANYKICRYLYRNPEGSHETKDEYLSVMGWIIKISIASEEVEKQSKIMTAKNKELTPAEGMAKDGKFVRTASPSFSFDYDKTMYMYALEDNEIFEGKFYDSPASKILKVRIFEIPENASLNKVLQGHEDKIIKKFAKRGLSIKILSNVPIENYGKYKAHEIKTEYKFRWVSRKSVFHIIAKEGKLIELSGETYNYGKLKSVLNVFKTLDLDPTIK